MTFSELGLREEVLRSIDDLGFSAPTPIQEQAIPHLLKEESDFVGLAQTGTGKTAAFGLPLISKLRPASRAPQGLVIAPTRELCMQIARDLESYSKHDKNTKIVAVYGGADIRRQITQLKDGVSIIVATPGRLMDLINRKVANLSEVDTVVLDEADEMLNMGFKEDIDDILESTPPTKNVWLFSATMPKEVASIAKRYMDNPFEISIGHKNQSNENIEHIYYTVKEKDRYAALKRLIDVNPTIFGLVFCRTRTETQSVAEKLGKEGYSAEPLHGDLSQAQRDRVMDRFRDRSLQLLVATDVAARGIDVDSITHVINYNLPDDIENYTHRSGRTARAGKKGESLVLVNTREGGKIRMIEKQIRVQFTEGRIPSASDICAIQLSSLISKVKDIEVKESDIEKFIPQIMSDFENLSKEEVIKKFISAEFNRFIDYYQRAGDLNASSERGGDREERGDRKERFDDATKKRFFVSLGMKDGLNRGGLLRVICEHGNVASTNVGRIDINSAYSFFEADLEVADQIIAGLNGVNFEGRDLKVEFTNESSGGGGRSDRDGDRRSGGGGRSFGGGGDRGRSGGGDRGRSNGGGFNDRNKERSNSFGEKRSYGDRPARTEGGSGERRSYGDRPARSEGGSSFGEKRSYGGDRSDRPARSSEGGEKRSYGDRPARPASDSPRKSNISSDASSTRKPRRFE